MRTKLLLMCCIIGMITMASCSKDEVSYSCDQEIDDWTKNNLDAIRMMSNDEYLDLDLSFQRAVFGAMTPSQRKTVWIEKFKDILTLDWNKEEEVHLKKLLTFVLQNGFIFEDEKSEEADDLLSLFMFRWTEYAYETLGWDVNFLYMIVADPNPVIKNQEAEIVSLAFSDANKERARLISISTRSSEECGCNKSDDWCGRLSVAIPFEGILIYTCSGSCVKESSWGCGTLFYKECNKVCAGKWIPRETGDVSPEA